MCSGDGRTHDTKLKLADVIMKYTQPTESLSGLSTKENHGGGSLLGHLLGHHGPKRQYLAVKFSNYVNLQKKSRLMIHTLLVEDRN